MEIFLISIGTVLIVTGITIFITGKKNKDTFKCDGCGRRYPLTNYDYYIYEDEMLCRHCYSAVKAPYKVEVKRD